MSKVPVRPIPRKSKPTLSPSEVASELAAIRSECLDIHRYHQEIHETAACDLLRHMEEEVAREDDDIVMTPIGSNGEILGVLSRVSWLRNGLDILHKNANSQLAINNICESLDKLAPKTQSEATPAVAQSSPPRADRGAVRPAGPHRSAS